MHKLAPAAITIITISIALIVSKMIGAPPQDSIATLVLLSLELFLIILAGLYYLDFRLTLDNSGAVVSLVIMGALAVYLYSSFKLYSVPLIALLVVGALALSIILLWNSREKTLRHYAGVTVLGVLGGALISYRFKDLSWISFLLGAMSMILIISLSLLLEEEDEKATS